MRSKGGITRASGTRQFWWKPSGPPQVEDLRPQRGVRALLVLEPRCKSLGIGNRVGAEGCKVYNGLEMDQSAAPRSLPFGRKF